MTISLDGNVGISLSGNVSAAGNVNGFNINAANTVTANLFVGTFQGNVSGNLVVPGANTQIIYNQSGNAGASINFAFDYGNANLVLNGNANVTGNVSGAYILGNGSQLTGLPATYANSDVSNYLASGTVASNIITTCLLYTSPSPRD